MIKDIAFTAYPAADVRALRTFYNDTLGLALTEPMEMNGTAAYCEAKIGEGYFVLLLEAWMERPKGSGCGIVFETDDIDTMVADLRAKGFAVEDPADFPNCKLTSFNDPEGNKVSLHQTIAR